MHRRCRKRRAVQTFCSTTPPSSKVAPGQLTRADRGDPMRAKATALMLADPIVTKSHSRPYTSNDNSFAESHFKSFFDNTQYISSSTFLLTMEVLRDSFAACEAMMRADWITGHWKRCANASSGRFKRAKTPRRLPAFWG